MEKRMPTYIVRCVFLLLLFFAFPSALAGGTDMAFLRVGVPAGSKPVTVSISPSKKAESAAVIEAGDSCEIIGEESKYYRVRCRGITGYVLKNQLTLSVERADGSIADALCPSLSLEDPIPERHEKYLVLQGEIRSGNPLQAVLIYLWDERVFQTEMCVMKTLDSPSSQIDASLFAHSIPLNKLEGGRKTLVVEGVTESATVVLYRAPVYVSGKGREPSHVTGMCSGIPASLLDDKVSTAWRPTKSKPSLSVSVPEQARAMLLTLEWKHVPEGFLLEQQNEAGETITSEHRSSGFYADYFELNPDTRRIILTPDQLTSDLSTLRIYAEPFSDHAVQQWEPIPDKIDILFISTHQDDELLFFGGAIPYYAFREDVTVAVLYMATCSRIRVREALDGLWTAGLKVHPIFLGLEDIHIFNKEEAYAKWSPYHPVERLADLLRQYRPEVVVCQDFNGEYGHAQHKVTAQMTVESTELAARGNGESAAAWQVKKLYVHLYDENRIQLDWDQPLTEDSPVTPIFLAKEAFDRHRSQQAYVSMHREGIQYDNRLFGLYFSAVGPDLQKNDFMENIR